MNFNDVHMTDYILVMQINADSRRYELPLSNVDL